MLAIEINIKKKNKYDSPIIEANQSLSKNTETFSSKGEIAFDYSSIKSYLAKQAKIPFNATLLYTKVIQGKNTPQYDQLEARLRFFF